MGTFKKLTKQNNQRVDNSNLGYARTQDNTWFVRAGLFNTLVNKLNALFTSDTSVSVDTIAESTSGSGVTIDSALIKDGEVVMAQETVTADGEALTVYGASSLDSTSNKVDSTLAAGTNIGTFKLIVMTEASNSSTVTIAAHETSDPEVATFDAVDEYWLGLWTGTEWVTVSNTCTFV